MSLAFMTRLSTQTCSRFIKRKGQFCARHAYWVSVSPETGHVLGWYCDEHRDDDCIAVQPSLFPDERKSQVCPDAPERKRRGKREPNPDCKPR